MPNSRLFIITRMEGDLESGMPIVSIELVSAQSIENAARYIEQVYMAESDTPAMLAYPDVWGNSEFKVRHTAYSGPFSITFRKYADHDGSVMDVLIKPTITHTITRYMIEPATVKCDDPQ